MLKLLIANIRAVYLGTTISAIRRHTVSMHF